MHLYSQAGGALRYDEARSCFRPTGPLVALRCVGAAEGEGIADAAPFWRVPASLARGRQWIDFQNDVTVDDIALAARESFVSVEHMKRYTTTGMATDQGKTSNVNALAILAAETSRAISAVGTTTFRPPYVPVTLGAIAGRHVRELYRPRRFLPAHRLHADAGAVFAEYGGWQRPEAYPRDGESVDAATAREVAAVRGRVGLFDGSPLGKIEIAGPDAELLLDHLFVTRIEGLGVGRIRYGVMASEHGIVLDDGVVTRFAADRFWLGASSAHAAHIAQAIDEWLQCEWTSWQVTVTDTTQQWAGIALAGPRARDVLAAAGTDIDLDNAAFPHMSVREGVVAGLPSRVARVSFSGELQYEIHVAAGHAITLWERLRVAGAAAAIAPIGMEAWLALRLEKGYPVVGIDTDGTTLPEDLAPSAWRRKTANFVGRRSLTRPHALREGREQLVGLECANTSVRLPIGAHLLPAHDAAPPCASAGRVTSSMLSAALGKSVALALLTNGRARIGESLVAFFDGRRYAAKVVPLPFYDPQGARLHG